MISSELIKRIKNGGLTRLEAYEIDTKEIDRFVECLNALLHRFPAIRHAIRYSVNVMQSGKNKIILWIGNIPQRECSFVSNSLFASPLQFVEDAVPL